ncbi:hypothetical protein KSP40_PGU010121 [Platanthera guangdongensis]|uniref:Uncharacterized protein n=1 Tax=Platanthera guangdongensis TaxID=2320717 RepID=A0ABR2MPG1_9ASPA
MLGQLQTPTPATPHEAPPALQAATQLRPSPSPNFNSSSTRPPAAPPPRTSDMHRHLRVNLLRMQLQLYHIQPPRAPPTSLSRPPLQQLRATTSKRRQPPCSHLNNHPALPHGQLHHHPHRSKLGVLQQQLHVIDPSIQ